MLTPGRRGAWVAAASAVGLVVSVAGGATAEPRSPDDRTTAGPSRTVTLITGDRVHLDGDRLGSVTGAPGRDRGAFQTFRRDGRLHVVPRDAVRPLAEGRLDLRLFDVTGLVEAGYDDARRDSVPLIVTGTGARAAAGALATRDLPAVDAVAARVPKTGASGVFDTLVADPGVAKVWLDGVRRTSLDRSTAQIGAPAAWSAGYTGEGVEVAVLDGGVDGEHPDLAGREVAERNFTEDPDASDLDGHGTHVAATIASGHPRYRGVAPGARILDGKVCVQGGCAESWILAGMQWAADQGADIVNLSLGGSDQPEVDPLEAAVDRLSAETGVLFVVAAGNSGRPGTVSSPSTADAALSVGAVERDDRIAPFSSRGPRAGDGGVKPDVTAPGVGIAAAKASKGTIGEPVDPTHVALSGTSMATPHVAGAAALLAQQHPDWTGAQLKAALVASARPNPDLTALDQGAGRVDLARAVTTTLTTDPVSVALGTQAWPHDDDLPVTGKLTYRNTGAQAQALELSAQAQGPDGRPAPAGLLTVAPSRITVPAGGTAEVTVTGDTRAGTLDGVYPGAVVASNGLRTPVSIGREVESYDTSFKYTDFGGEPAQRASTLVVGLSNDVIAFPRITGGAAAQRLPKGDYLVLNSVDGGDGRTALLPQPLLRVDAATVVDADARAAKPVRITFPDLGAVETSGDITLSLTRGDRRISAGNVFLGGFGDRVATAHLGPALPAGELSTLVHAHATGAPIGRTPVNYRVAWVGHREVPTGFTRAPGRDELAEVRTSIGPRAAGRTYRYGGLPIPPDGGGSSTMLTPVGPDGDAVDRVLAEGLAWSWVVLVFDAEGRPEGMLRSPDRTYRAGREHLQRFGRPVLGPSLPRQEQPYVTRLGDEIGFYVPLWGDADGNRGDSGTETARTTLHRDGVQVGETPYAGSGRFEVPAGPGDFAVATEAVRPAGSSEFSTRVAARWTFRSDTVPGAEPAPVALTVVRFAPELDAAGSAPAGRVLRVPLDVQRQRGAPDGEVRELRVEASFDDGRTWSKVPVAGRTALVRNAAGGFASLRVTGSDSRGNTFEHTVVRAYKIRG